MNLSESEESHNYCVIFNIPSSFRSKHLRNYFNELIENKSFNCFHYRHRPQKVVIKSDENQEKVSQLKRFCAIIDIKTERMDDLFNKFDKKFWIDSNGSDLEFKCFIKKIKIIDNNVDNDCNQKSNDKTLDLWRKMFELNSSLDTRHRNNSLINRLKNNPKSDDFELDFEDNNILKLTINQLKSLRELNPPKDIMPNGNVGTSSHIFLQLIRECRLPAIVISKLDLEFPKSMRKKVYSNVQFKYEDKRRFSKTLNDNKFVNIETLIKKSTEDQFNDYSVINKTSDQINKCLDKNSSDYDLELVKTRNGFIINDNFTKSNHNFDKETEFEVKNKDVDEEPEDEELEEWDRHESLHEDVTQQGRIKERLFEDEIELQWEKGGSGLVFYTDSQFWELNENKGDFDEKTADDWDLDMSLYRQSQGSADKEAIDLDAIRSETKLRKGKRKFHKYSVESIFEKKSNPKIGYFEKHTKGFGRQLMERQGWTSGSGLGKSIIGIPEPIPDCGQLPNDKRGFGYRGEKLNSFQFKKPSDKKF